MGFRAGTVVFKTRVYALRLQYRVGWEGPFRDVKDLSGAPVEYLRHASAGHTQAFTAIPLPEDARNQPYVQLIWRYYRVSGSSGARAQLRLDDIAVSSRPVAAEGVAVFLPGGDGSWTQSFNWSTQIYPNSLGAKAALPPPAGGDRNVELFAPVTIGSLSFDLGNSPSRNRLRDRNSGNLLRWDNGADPASLRVSGTGSGYAEIQVDAGTFLASDLEVRVDSVVGNPEYGALRLREGWSGPGGLRKLGDGILSLTGPGKSYTGATVVERGVLRVTELSAPANSSGVSVLPGGQLRIVSSSAETALPRYHTFGGTLVVSGPGRGGEIPVGAQEGIQGALRFDPGGQDNWSVVTNSVHLPAYASLHVDGSRNTLELAGGISGPGPFSKSGGGSLILGGPDLGYAGAIQVDNGVLRLDAATQAAITLGPGGILRGNGTASSLSGSGLVDLEGTRLALGAVGALQYRFLFSQTGSPDYANPAASGNPVIHLLHSEPLLEAVTPSWTVDIFLDWGPVPVPGERARGAFFASSAQPLEEILSAAAVRVFIPAEDGTMTYRGRNFRLASPLDRVSLRVVPERVPSGSSSLPGWTLEAVVNPGPSSFLQWIEVHFPNPADRLDPAISGKLADPSGSGLNHWLRYALGIGPTEDPHLRLPRLAWVPGWVGLQFPFDRARSDLAYVVERSENLSDWDEVLFDSRLDLPPDDGREWILVQDGEPFSTLRPMRFLRLRVVDLSPSAAP